MTVRKDGIRCESIRGTEQLRCCGDRDSEPRSRWCGQTMSEQKDAEVGISRREAQR